ncbi:Hypothetical predicted protein [Cloeon dipterum]|uniref:C-type lectin domain-containing protein n=1 Tax=Cloeon dipterum TaxID=197152 RepID=A0A8S1E3C8_9INSE|nr:Hypothetical predicted protein [Cloeon dipterum]
MQQRRVFFLFALLLCLQLFKQSQARKCLSSKEQTGDLCSSNMEFLKTEIEKATQEYKNALEHKVDEIARILRHMSSENVARNEVMGSEDESPNCSISELAGKLANFENELTATLKEIPNRINKSDVKFEMTVKKFEQDKLTTMKYLDVRLGELKTQILTEVYAKFADVIQSNEKLNIGRQQTMQNLESRISLRLEPLVANVERKMADFMDNLANVTTSDSNKIISAPNENNISNVDEIVESLNSTLLTIVHKYFSDREAKEAEHDRRVEESIENFDEKITNLVAPIALDVKSNALRISRQIEQLDQDWKERGDEIESLLRQTTESLKKMENKLLSECSKSGRLNITTIATGRYYFSTVEVSWFRAKDFCERFGMQLATIETDEERRALHVVAPIKNDYYWLSGSDIGNLPGHFNWVSEEQVEDTWWANGQPNDFGEGKQTCVELFTNNGLLIDYKCSDDDYFICELNPECEIYNVQLPENTH